MSCFLGMYFWQRKADGDLRHRLGWAVTSTTIASVVEFPFDHAKHKMLGSLRSAALTSAIRIPLGAFLLLVYDQVLTGGLAVG